VEGLILPPRKGPVQEIGEKDLNNKGDGPSSSGRKYRGKGRRRGALNRGNLKNEGAQLRMAGHYKGNQMIQGKEFSYSALALKRMRGGEGLQIPLKIISGGRVRIEGANTGEIKNPGKRRKERSGNLSSKRQFRGVAFY